MKYYKVQKDNGYWDMKTGEYLGYVCENELLTEADMKKKGYPITKNFKPVEIKKTDTYKAFGCRWECHK